MPVGTIGQQIEEPIGPQAYVADPCTKLGQEALLRNHLFIAELEAHLDEDRRGALDLATRWAARDELDGRDVEVRVGDETLAGRADGLEDDGRLRVRSRGGEIRRSRSAETAGDAAAARSSASPRSARASVVTNATVRSETGSKRRPVTASAYPSTLSWRA